MPFLLTGHASTAGDELETENAALQQDLVRASSHFAGLDTLFAVQSTMAELASLNQQLSISLVGQSETIDKLDEDAVQIADNVDGGNKELEDALSNHSTGCRNLLVAFLLGASACLLVLDYIGS
eukprot:SAG11_NODE_4128_length_2050_cov_1.717068_1_plen_124_part_00